jgi:hypothetical protein
MNKKIYNFWLVFATAMPLGQYHLQHGNRVIPIIKKGGIK